MAARLKKITIKGFKSLKEVNGLELGPISILIGANGAGKSNFISFFRMLSWTLTGSFQEHVSRSGGANRLLHDGAKKTESVSAELTFETQGGKNDYAFRLAWAAGDTLIFTDERYRFSREPSLGKAEWRLTGTGGHTETKMSEAAEAGERTAKFIRGLLQKVIVYQFHDTSATSRIRGKWSVEDNRWLKEDGGNLGPFLLRLRESEAPYYRRITETIRAVIPFFDDFVLEREYGSVMLKWREKGTDMIFDASQASDGMLRMMALVTVLAQPERDLPAVLVFDEPELGQHPYAVEVLAGLVQNASCHSQVILATQSADLVNRFRPEHLVVVDRKERESIFRRLDPDPLKEWLKEYSLVELWEKNVLGGRPG